MSVESLIPMVNRWLEGVNSAMAISSASQDDSSEDEIEDDEDEELSSPTSDTTASTTSVPRSGHDYDKKKSFRSRFFKKSKEKYIDYNDNLTDSQPDLLPHIACKRSLSTEDLPRNLEPYSGQYEIEHNSQEPYFYYSRSKRESIDSTVAQRPFSPCSTLAASDQSLVCEEDIVLMSPRFRGITSQRRASDGMVQRIPVQWTMQESNQGISSSFTDVNGTCSRASSRPATPATPTAPASPFIKIKASGGFKLPPLNAPIPRRPKLQELPSITVSDNSGSGSQGSLESFPDEQPCAAPKHIDQTYLIPTEKKSFFAVKNAKHLLQRRRGSLPTVMSAIRQSALPIVKEEHPHPEEGRNKKPAPSPDKHVNLQIPRHRFRSKSLDGQLGLASEWEQYKARAMERRMQFP